MYYASAKNTWINLYLQDLKLYYNHESYRDKRSIKDTLAYHLQISSEDKYSLDYIVNMFIAKANFGGRIQRMSIKQIGRAHV